jgi:hypothetical protein
MESSVCHHAIIAVSLKRKQIWKSLSLLSGHEAGQLQSQTSHPEAPQDVLGQCQEQEQKK